MTDKEKDTKDISVEEENAGTIGAEISSVGDAEEITNWSSDTPTTDDTDVPDDAEEEPEFDGDDVELRKKKKEKPQQREKKKRDGSQKKDKPEEKEPSAVGEYVRGIKHEMRMTTWPKKNEVLKWSIIVTAVIAFFALLTFLIDNFVTTPIMYFISGLSVDASFGPGSVALIVLFFASGLGSMFGVMLHSGGDSNGLSDTLSTQLTGGSAVAERNLDRLTIAMALLFVLSIVLMMIFFPQGTINGF